MHWGGGPPIGTMPRLPELMQYAREPFSAAGQGLPEYSIEIDPRTSIRRHRPAWAWVFNRISLGIQDFDPWYSRPSTASSPARWLRRWWMYPLAPLPLAELRSIWPPNQDRHTTRETLRKVNSRARTASPATTTRTCRSGSAASGDRPDGPAQPEETAVAADDQPHLQGCRLPAYRRGPPCCP